MLRKFTRSCFSLSVSPLEAAIEHVHQFGQIPCPTVGEVGHAGARQTDPPFDRLAALSPPNPPNTPNDPNPINRNHHQLTPHEVTIQAGGTVNFIVGGFHHILVYDDETQPTNINAMAANSFFPLLNDDPNKRIYRGLNPQTVPQDRVETVHFPKRGTFLVMRCPSAFRQ